MVHELLRRARQRLEAAGADHEPPVGPGVLILITLIFIDRAHRFAATSGMTATPMPAATIWPIASKLFSRARNRRRAPSRAACALTWACSAIDEIRPTKSRSTTSPKVDLSPVRQFVPARGDQHQTIFAERDPLDIVWQRVLGGEPEIGGAGQDGAGDIGAFAFLDVDRDVGVLAQEGGQRLRQIFRKARRVGEEADGGLHAACKGQQIAAHRLDIVDHDPGMIEQAFTGRRQLDAAPAARQQRYAERFLQSLDPRARRSQREMNACRTVGDAAVSRPPR